MNKVVCNVCGTSYPENAAQCPICGFVRNAENAGFGIDENKESTYTHVKGGRYSKANVRKRNLSSQNSESVDLSTSNTESEPQKSKNKAGVIVIAVVLMLVIVAVAGYLALRFFIPNDFIYDGLESIKDPVSSNTEHPTNETISSESNAVEDMVNNSITLSDSQIILREIGQTYELLVTLDAESAVDNLQFTSSDPAVITVDTNGIITANAEGTAVITVTDGTVKAECTVICTAEAQAPETEATEPAPTEPSVNIVLNRREITFDMEGQSWMLYDGGEIAASEIQWTSDDPAIVTITDGKVVAVANGDTAVHGAYGDQTVSCIIHCAFDEESGGTGNSSVSEAGSESSRSYSLYNPYGLSDDVTIHVDEQFPLMLVDESKNEIKDAQWSIGNTACCSYENNTVTGLTAGTTEVTATYEGMTYTCVVRVVE